MAMRFRYRHYTIPSPAISLGGRPTRPKPVINLLLTGPSGSQSVHGLLDTGADDTVFPEAIAAALGIDLTNAPTGGAAGISSGPAVLRYAQVTLEVTDGVEAQTWTDWVAFTSAPMRVPLLGYAGFLRWFTATFDGFYERVALEANRTMPPA